jgi:putative transposase
MGSKHFTEEQIAFALRQAESGTSVTEVIRKLGISEQMFYRWKKGFAGLGIAELRRLRTLEEENRELKQLVADLSLDNEMLQDVLSKKSPMDPYPCVPTHFPSRAPNTNVFL